MENNIGYSSIYGNEGFAFQGPRGSTGATGANQTIPGPTGNTGSDSNYITDIKVNDQTGEVEFLLSDGIWHAPSPGNVFKGATGAFAGITFNNLGGGIPIVKGVCGGITLQFYNIRADGRIGITYDSDGSLKFTINPNINAGAIDPYIQNNRIIYASTNKTATSTDLINERISVSDRIGNNPYGFVNFGGETAGRNVVADIIETQLSVGPISRGEKVLETSDHYKWGIDGITLDLSRASVYRVATPIGIKAFSTDTLGDGQKLFVTLIVDGDDVWNFPTNVYFDKSSNAVFYPGTNILQLSKSFDSDYWTAHFSARGFGITGASSPGLRGSCCYLDADDVKQCEEYVLEHYCNERNGVFAALLPCSKNPCLLSTDDKGYDGICCTEGHCVPDVDPDICQIIGGYFLSGITCGAYTTEFPETDKTTNETGLCNNYCKPIKICCKNGECLGQQTDKYCTEALGGVLVVANDCETANCCDHIKAPGACCVIDEEGKYSCFESTSPFDCKTTLGGVYMGRNTNCTTTDICCSVPNDITCWKCFDNSGTCNCVAESGTTPCYERGTGYYTTEGSCQTNCVSKTYFKCNGTNCDEITTCDAPPSGYSEGSCSTDPCVIPVKKCYTECDCSSLNCLSKDIELNGYSVDTPCSQLVDGTDNSEYTLDSCNCGQEGICVPSQFAACFWCYPDFPDDNGIGGDWVNQEVPKQLQSLSCNTINGPCSDSSLLPCSHLQGTANWSKYANDLGASPYRAVLTVDEDTKNKLDTNTNFSFNNNFNSNAQVLMKLHKYKGYHYIEERQFGSEIIHDSIPVDFSPAGDPIRAPKSYCTYIGSYKLEPITGNQDEQVQAVRKREKDCLARFGYVPQSEGGMFNDSDFEDTKQIVQPIGGLGYVLSTIRTTTTLNYIEPYQKVMNNNLLFAPLPPIWGRVTYYASQQLCGGGMIGTTTNGLMLFNPEASLDMANAFRYTGDPTKNIAGVSYGWQWWHRYTGGAYHHNLNLNKFRGPPINRHDQGLNLYKLNPFRGVPFELPPYASTDNLVDKYNWPIQLVTDLSTHVRDLRYEYLRDMRKGIVRQLGIHGDEGLLGKVNVGCGCVWDNCICSTDSTDVGGPCETPNVQGVVLRFDPYRMGASNFYASSDWPDLPHFEGNPNVCPLAASGNVLGSKSWGIVPPYGINWKLPDWTSVVISTNRIRMELPYNRLVSYEPEFRWGCNGANDSLNSSSFQSAGGEVANARCDEFYPGYHTNRFTQQRDCGHLQRDYGRAVLGRNIRYSIDRFRISNMFWNETVDSNGDVNVDDEGIPYLTRTINPTSLENKGLPIFIFVWWDTSSTNTPSEGCYDTDWDSTDPGPGCKVCCKYKPEERRCCSCGNPVRDCGQDIWGCGQCMLLGEDTLGICCRGNRIDACFEDEDKCALQCGNEDNAPTNPNTGGGPSPFTANTIAFRRLQDSSPDSILSSIPNYKSVEISPGICVNMICPECYSYESC